MQAYVLYDAPNTPGYMDSAELWTSSSQILWD
jgi:hypothetical protein